MTGALPDLASTVSFVFNGNVVIVTVILACSYAVCSYIYESFGGIYVYICIFIYLLVIVFRPDITALGIKHRFAYYRCVVYMRVFTYLFSCCMSRLCALHVCVCVRCRKSWWAATWTRSIS